MIGLDTNVLARYLLQDDPAQGRAATQLIHRLDASDRGFIPLVALVELQWLLRVRYGLPVDAVVHALARLRQSAELEFESASLVTDALAMFARGADFPDALIALSAARAGCATTMTFDRNAAKTAGMTLLGKPH